MRALSSVLCTTLLLVCIPHSYATDLLSLYIEARQQDTEYAIALAEVLVGDEKAVQGRAGLLPQLSLESQTSMSNTSYELDSGSQEHRRQNRNYGVQLTQPVFRWKNWIEYEQGDLQKAVAETRLRKADQALIVRVAETYFAALNSEDIYDSIAMLRKSYSEQLASARKNFELGNVSIADVHEAQASFDRASANLIRANNDKVIAYQYLAKIVARTPGSLKGLSEPVYLTAPQPALVDEWLSVVESENPDIQIQKLLLDIVAHEVKRKKAEHLPTIDLFVSHNMQQNPSANTESSESSSIGLRLSMPLYSGGRTRSGVREALAMHSQAEYELEDARRTARVATWDAWSGVISGIAQVQALEAAQKSAQLAVDSNLMGYEVGVRVGIDVLQVQSQLSETMQQLSRARYDTLLAQLRLKAAVGALQEKDVEDINALLQHCPHNSKDMDCPDPTVRKHST